MQTTSSSQVRWRAGTDVPKSCAWTSLFRHVVRNSSILLSTARGEDLAESTVKQNPSTPQVRRTDAFTLRVAEQRPQYQVLVRRMSPYSSNRSKGETGATDL